MGTVRCPTSSGPRCPRAARTTLLTSQGPWRTACSDRREGRRGGRQAPVTEGDPIPDRFRGSACRCGLVSPELVPIFSVNALERGPWESWQSEWFPTSAASHRLNTARPTPRMATEAGERGPSHATALGPRPAPQARHRPVFPQPLICSSG